MSKNYFKQHLEFSSDSSRVIYGPWIEVASLLLYVSFGLPGNKGIFSPLVSNILLVKIDNNYTNIPHYADFYT